MNDELNIAKNRSQVRREKNRRRRKRKKEFKTPPKKWDIQLKSYLILVAVFVLIIGSATIKTINNNRLALYGDNKTAYVYSSKKLFAEKSPYGIIGLKFQAKNIVVVPLAMRSPKSVTAS